MALNIKKIPLETGEYYTDVVAKKTIYIHHTAGSHRADWTVNGWNQDRNSEGERIRVATAYVIGGISTTDGNADWDGVIVNCFDDKLWAHHLGLKTSNNTQLNKESIAIEICNYGYVTKGKDGKWYNYVNKPVPDNQVVELAKPFKNYTHYQKYSDKQLASLKALLQDIAARHTGINLKAGLKPLLDAGKGVDAFELSNDALAGAGGVWTHTNVRTDKFDCSPQPALIDLIRSL